MDKKMFTMRVYTKKESDYIYIQQTSDEAQENNNQISIHPDQIDVLIQWLEKARAEIFNKGNDARHQEPLNNITIKGGINL